MLGAADALSCIGVAADRLLCLVLGHAEPRGKFVVEGGLYGTVPVCSRCEERLTC